MPSDTTPDGAVKTLTCQPLREGDTLVFPYQIANGGRADIYVMDAVAEWDADTSKVHLNTNSVVIAQASDGFAHIMKGIAPLPADRSVAVRVIPLAGEGTAGGTLERRLEVGLPLHKTDPYHPDLPVDANIASGRLPGSCSPSSTVRGGGGVCRCASRCRAGPVPRDGRRHRRAVVPVSCRYPSRGLTILQRTDDFPRPK